METISLFAISEEISSNGEVIKPLIEINPHNIPTHYSFAITVGISRIDLSKDNTIRYIIFDPKNKNIFDTTDITLPRKSEIDDENNQNNNFKDIHNGFIANLNLRNFLFNEQGEYKIVLKINNKEKGKYYFNVIS